MGYSKVEQGRRAITLTELAITLIIIGIVAGLALPRFNRTIESTKAQEAMVGLKQIRTGERIYRTEEDTYFYSSAGSAKEKIEEINCTLSLFLNVLDDRNWDYKVEVGETAETTFDATATRKGGSYNGRTIVLDEDGPPFTGNWPLPLPE